MIDDRFPGIQYSPASDWVLSGNSNEQYGTTHGTQASGATFTFNFLQGTSIQVYGTLAPGNNLPTTYDVDGESMVFSPPTVSNVQYHQLFYASPSLALGQHILTVMTGTGSGSYWFDYMLYSP
ncbi:hypothetical protein K488DRAFT_57009, partial [Vararia minispora EC-137]